MLVSKYSVTLVSSIFGEHQNFLDFVIGVDPWNQTIIKVKCVTTNFAIIGPTIVHRFTCPENWIKLNREEKNLYPQL